MAANNADEKVILQQMQQMRKEVIKSMDQMQLEVKKVMTTREFEAEDGKNIIWYQSLRLFNEGLVPRSKIAQPQGLDLGEESKFLHGSDYSELKFVGVGGEHGKEEIWNESLLH